jgi:hypothetical protein
LLSNVAARGRLPCARIALAPAEVHDPAMRSAVARVLLASALVVATACGARQIRPEHSSQAAADAPETGAVQSRYREMTWPEYYSEVTDRVWKRGGTVVWVSPPRVRKAKPADAPAGR